MKNTINWQRVEEHLSRSKSRSVLKAYGSPDITNPFTSAFAEVDVMPRWDIDKSICVSVALTGGFFMKRHNKNQPITESEIIKHGIECLEMGATSLHIHVRNENELSIVDYKKFHNVIGDVKKQFPSTYISAGEVAIGMEDWSEMNKLTTSGIIDGSPVNTTATFIGDTLFAKPPSVMIKKTDLLQNNNVKPEIAVYTDGDVDNANRYLIKSGLLKKPYYWVLLPALPGCSPMHNPKQMIDGLTRTVSLIKDIDDKSIISVCAAGRPSLYLVTLAAIMGLHVRVGMEDTVWVYPHQNKLIENNKQIYLMIKNICELLGREIMSSIEFKELIRVKDD